MKIALLLTGHLRTHRNHLPFTMQNIMLKGDCDIYCATWNCLGLKGEDRVVTPKDLSIYEPRLKNFAINDFDEYERTKKEFKRAEKGEVKFWENKEGGRQYALAEYDYGTDDYWVNRIIDQWHTVKKGFELIKDPEQYDLIFRLRYDTRVTHVNLLTDKDIVVPHPHPYEHLYAMRDHLAYGTPEGMRKYCNIYDHAEEMFINNINLRAEGLLHYYLENIEPEIGFYVDPNFVEYKNYWIMK